jgi:hypothetical protein
MHPPTCTSAVRVTVTIIQKPNPCIKSLLKPGIVINRAETKMATPFCNEIDKERKKNIGLYERRERGVPTKSKTLLFYYRCLPVTSALSDVSSVQSGYLTQRSKGPCRAAWFAVHGLWKHLEELGRDWHCPLK